MKKVFLLGAAALFSLALVATSCSDDDKNETCITCSDGTTELEYCYEEGNAIDALAKWSDFISAHPDHTDCTE